MIDLIIKYSTAFLIALVVVYINIFIIMLKDIEMRYKLFQLSAKKERTIKRLMNIFQVRGALFLTIIVLAVHYILVYVGV